MSEVNYFKYAFKVEYWDDEEKSVKNGYGVLWAETSTKALEKISHYYGEDDLNSVFLVMEDEDPIFFSDENTFDDYINRNAPFAAY